MHATRLLQRTVSRAGSQCTRCYQQTVPLRYLTTTRQAYNTTQLNVQPVTQQQRNDSTLASQVTATNTSAAANSSPLAATAANDNTPMPDTSLDTSVFTNRNIPPFNTYKLMKNLRNTGLSEQQAEVLMQCLIQATQDAMDSANTNLSTKSDFSALKVQLNEKIFNISLKYDMQQKHLREMFTTELQTLKNDATFHAKSFESDFKIFQSDIKMSQKTDLFGIQQQLNRIEKEIETDKKTLILSQDQLENRLIKYALGFVASFGALALTAIRLFGSAPPKQRKPKHNIFDASTDYAYRVDGNPFIDGRTENILHKSDPITDIPQLH